MRKRMPSDFEKSARFFGRFTWKDLLRLGLPPGFVLWLVDLSRLSFVTMALLLVSVIVAAIWYLWRPFGDPIEVQLYHLLRWCLRKVIRL